MIVALDYDDTYTRDPLAWARVVDVLKAAGHEVLCVTWRNDTDANRKLVVIPGLRWNQHYFTQHTAKKRFMERQGICVDVWIDDNPEAVLRDHDQIGQSEDQYRRHERNL